MRGTRGVRRSRGLTQGARQQQQAVAGKKAISNSRLATPHPDHLTLFPCVSDSRPLLSLFLPQSLRSAPRSHSPLLRRRSPSAARSDSQSGRERREPVSDPDDHHCLRLGSSLTDSPVLLIPAVRASCSYTCRSVRHRISDSSRHPLRSHSFCYSSCNTLIYQPLRSFCFLPLPALVSLLWLSLCVCVTRRRRKRRRSSQRNDL